MTAVLKSKLPAEKRLELVHVSLMREKQFAFFAGLFMVGKTTIVDAPSPLAPTGAMCSTAARSWIPSPTRSWRFLCYTRTCTSAIVI